MDGLLISRSEKRGVVVIVKGELDDELVQSVWEVNDDSSRRLQYLTRLGVTPTRRIPLCVSILA